MGEKTWRVREVHNGEASDERFPKSVPLRAVSTGNNNWLCLHKLTRP